MRRAPHTEIGMNSLQELLSLEGKTAVVTGGGRGLGRIAAEALLRAGARVLIASRKRADCEAAAEALSPLGQIEGFEGDVATAAGVAALVAEIRKRTGVVDVLLNNAGATWGASLETFPWDAWGKVMSVNVTGAFTLTRDLLPELCARATLGDPSRVINVGSILGIAPIPDDSYSYGASKAALHHVTRVLAGELAPRHITVNAIAPGPFESKMTAFALGRSDVRESVAESMPLGRIGEPDDIAGAVLFLSGRGGRYVTGSILPLDGGLSIEARSKLLTKHL